MNTYRSIRFGIMCTGTEFPAWQADCIRALLDVPGVAAGLLIVEPAAEVRRSPLRKLLDLARRRDAAWSVYEAFHVRRRSKALAPVDLSEALDGIPRVVCRTERRGAHSEYFAAQDVERIREGRLDFILRFSFGIIRGPILRAARWGVWSFHHDDEEAYRGLPPCFWEVYRGEPVTGSILQRLTQRLDGGIVLRKGFFATESTSYISNLDQALFASAGWPAALCREFQAGAGEVLHRRPSRSTAPIFRTPGNLQLLLLLLKLSARGLRRQIRDLLCHDYWNVGLVRSPIQGFLSLNRPGAVDWLPPPPRGRYLADPFGLQDNGRLVVLAESFDYASQRGSIVARDNGRMLQAIDADGHLSYPFLLRHEGRVYCIPEASDSGNVTLFSARSLPGEWIREATLLSGFPAVDPTLFLHGGRWWLFCTEGSRGCNYELHAWHAPDLRGPYRPHAANPIKVDVRSARPAGTPFEHGGYLHRPAQDDSETYGGAVVLNRVLRLTPTTFEERAVQRITPHRDYAEGLHTISAAGPVTLIDGKKFRFVPRHFAATAGAKLRRLAGIRR